MKNFKKLLLVLTSLTLASCGKCITHIDANHDGKCDECGEEVKSSHVDADQNGICDVCEAEISHIDNNDDNICDICGFDLSKEITIDTVLQVDHWNQDVRDMIDYVIGEGNSSLIGTIPAPDGYKVYLEEMPYADGSGSQLACVINLYGVESQKSIDDVEEALVKKGFFFGYSSQYVYKMINPCKDLIIQYEQYRVGKKTFLELIIYTSETRQAEWPADDIYKMMGMDIPVYACESYEYYPYIDDAYNPVIVVYDHNTGEDGLVKYHNQILASGNFILKENTADGYTYLSKDGKVTLSIYPYADEYERDTIYIVIQSNWTYFYNTIMLGEDIPCYDIQSLYWMFQDHDGDGTAEYLVMFYDNKSIDDLPKCLHEFIQAGWEIDEEESTETSKILVKVINGLTKTINVCYAESGEMHSIIVAFK